MKDYYFHDGSNQHGPFTLEELKQQKITPETSVWNTNITDWKKASQFEELTELFKKIPPPFHITKNSIKTNKKNNATYYIVGAIIVIFLVYHFFSYKQRKGVETTSIQKSNIKNNIRRYVTVGNSAYHINGLGGINGLSIIITNNSDYLLDKVVVLVRYIKANGEDWKKESIDFSLIPPRTQMTLRAPDSERGTSIDYKIESISSTALRL